MNEEQEKKVIKEAQEKRWKYDDVVVTRNPEIIVAPDSFWVQAWIAVDLGVGEKV